MNTSWLNGSDELTKTTNKIQIHTSPYAVKADFSALDTLIHSAAAIDLVSLADLLRNAFVYPPHTIYRDVKVVATGFDPDQVMGDDSGFHFPYQTSLAPVRPASGSVSDADLLRTYHRLLCDAVQRCTASMKNPWVLQSGGKDSTSLAIVLADVRPDVTCVTYQGGPEENEIESARFVARKLGLRHEAFVCNPVRAYARYLAMVPRMPLLTADFAALSYADLATEIGLNGGDGIIDGLGVDPFIGVPVHFREHAIMLLARGLRIPSHTLTLPLIRRSFKLCFALSTLQMNAFERLFPGSRFSDEEVDDLFGWDASRLSKKRIATFHSDIMQAHSLEARRRIALVICESSAMAKGLFAARAEALQLAFPYCDRALCEWIFHNVPDDRLMGPHGLNKILMRRHIEQRFPQLPYVQTKGSFRFHIHDLAQQCYDQVYAFAEQGRVFLPGAPQWLEAHRKYLDNKYFASKFYLLAVTLPWLLSRRSNAQDEVAARLQLVTADSLCKVAAQQQTRIHSALGE